MSAMAETRSRRPRRRFTDEFKQQAVRLVLDEGKSVTGVARELDLVPSALGQWVKQAQADRTKGRTGLTTAEREELARLRKENRILQEEREILKKAAVFSIGRRNTISDRRDHVVCASSPNVVGSEGGTVAALAPWGHAQ